MREPSDRPTGTCRMRLFSASGAAGSRTAAEIRGSGIRDAVSAARGARGEDRDHAQRCQ